MISSTRVRLAAAAFILASAIPSAFAQAPSADQVKAAREVIEASGAASSVKDIVPIFLDKAKQTFTRTRPEIAKDLDEALKTIEPEFVQRRDALLNEIATIYAGRFSMKELGEIKAFYGTPTGAKLVQNLPAIMQSSYAQTSAWSQKMSQDIVARLRQEMRKRGVEI
jgi:hypothetical protein